MISKKTIAVIDDEEINHIILSGVLSSVYDIKSYKSSKHFLEEYTHFAPDLILLDIVMPELDGYETIIEINKKFPDRKTPIMFLTAKNDNQDEAKGFQLGAADYITKPFVPIVLAERIKTHLKLVEIQNQLKQQNDSLNKQVEERISEYNLIQDLSLSIIADIVERRDKDTGNHIIRIQHFFKIIAEELKSNSIYSETLKDIDVQQLSKASILHDIGKVAIPDNILKKPGKLDSDEWIIMKKHCLYGKQVIDSALNRIRDGADILTYELNNLINFFSSASDIALYHHERWDGTGYPTQLNQTHIPLSARIMAVVDVFDALAAKRVYKDSWSLDEILKYMDEQRNLQFDSVIIDALFSKMDVIKKIRDKYID